MNPLPKHTRYLNGAPLIIARKPYRSTEKCLILVIFCTFVLVFCGTFYLPELRSSGVARFSRAYKQVQDIGPDFLIPPPPHAEESKDSLHLNHHSVNGEDPHLIEDRDKLKAKVEEDQRNQKVLERPDFFTKMKTSSSKSVSAKVTNLDQPDETLVKKQDMVPPAPSDRYPTIVGLGAEDTDEDIRKKRAKIVEVSSTMMNQLIQFVLSEGKKLFIVAINHHYSAHVKRNPKLCSES